MTTTTTAAPILSRPYQGAYRQEVENEPENNDNTPATHDQNPSNEATTDNGPELNPEERTYKTRYDSLKAHYDKTIVEARKREAELTKQLSSAKNRMEVPSNPEEFKGWKTQYPDLYRMILSVAREELSETSAELQEKFTQLELLSKQARRDKAEAALLRLHPDFEDLRNDEKFHQWVREQPAQIQSWLYDNEDDPLLAAKAIDLYKAERGVKKPKPRTDLKEAARAISKTEKANDPEVPQGKIWKLSEIKKLNRSQFEKFEEEIDRARTEGRIDYDI